MMDLSPTICLNMIVKDEAPIIERCLASVLPIVDHFVICDTGSGDGTPDIVQGFFDRHGIRGTVHQAEFVDFAATRNHALELCRATTEPFDYILLADADMELRIERADLRRQLSDPVYALRQSNRISYYNTRLLRREIPARYIGVTHEYLEVSAPVRRLEGAWFADHACGSSREHKVERDIRLLTAGLVREPDNARYMFYLAQTYKDAGEHALAIEWYSRRLAAGGWDEELWYARYMQALCQLRIGNEAAFVQGCLEAYDFRPTRAEPIHALAKYYREQGRNEACLLMCEAGEGIPYPADDQLFIDDEVYRRGFREEASIAGFYCRKSEHQEKGRAACLTLATERAANPSTRATARQNTLFYARSAAEVFGQCWLKELDVDVGEGFRATNPSICRYRGRMHGIIRVVDYALEGRVYRTLGAGNTIHTSNYFTTFDDAFGIVDLQPIRDWTLAEAARHPRDRSTTELRAAATMPIAPLPRFPISVRGFEDCRLFEWRGRLWCSAAARDTNPEWRSEMVLLELDDAHDIVAVHVNREVHPGRHQKNWVPLVAGDDLYFVYSSDPTVVVRFDRGTEDAVGPGFTVVQTELPELALEHCRGGSQAVAIEDGWLFVAHEVIENALPSRVYLHRLVRLDRRMRVMAVSDPFYFTHKGVEFAAGLVYDTVREALVISFGIGDAKACLATLDARSVLATLTPAGPPFRGEPKE